MNPSDPNDQLRHLTDSGPLDDTNIGQDAQVFEAHRKKRDQGTDKKSMFVSTICVVFKVGIERTCA